MSPTCVARHPAARWLVALATVAATLPARRAEGQQATVSMPAAGTPVRRAALHAVRRHLKTTATFKVAHFAVSGSYAFLRAGEVVNDGENLQETDLFVETMLERGKDGRWRVLHLWNLVDEGEKRVHDAFLTRVRGTMRERSLPITLLPDDLRPASGA